MTTSAEILNPDVAKQVAWIVYINGLEVPVVSASISYGVWQIPQCQLVMVPDPVLQRLGAEDRVSVQVFYCDYWQTPDNPQFRLMYDGEIVSWSYVNTVGGRSIVFTCVDYIQLFTQLFFFFMSSVDDIAIGSGGTRVGAHINTIQLAGFGAAYPYSLFTQGLASPAATPEPSTTGEPYITRPIDFLYNVVKSLTKQGHYNQSVPAANFFAPWVRKTNFNKRFIAIPFLEELITDTAGQVTSGVFPILRAVNQEQALAAVVRSASDVGTSGSIWQMLQTIMQTLMMEICMLPTAACVDSDFGIPPSITSEGLQSRISGESKGLTINGPAVEPGSKDVSTSPGKSKGFNFLTQYFVKPQFLFGLPPVCNVFFPSQISNLAYEENYIVQPTRTYFNVDNVLELLKANTSATPGLLETMRNNLSVAHPEEVNQLVRQGMSNGLNGKNLLVYPEEFFKGPVVDRRIMPRWFAYLQQSGNAASSETVPDNNRQVTAGDSARNVYRLYAAYEYHKERYSNRTGGVQMAFNPYPVPGFPCAVFDRRSTQVDLFGYIMSVNQSLSHNGWSTSVSFSYARTVKEVFSLLARQFELENESLDKSRATITTAVEDSSNSKDTTKQEQGRAVLSSTADPLGAIAIAPPEPIVEVRDIIQNIDRANLFYRSLFYREKAPTNLQTMEEQLRAEANRETDLATDSSTQSITAIGSYTQNTGNDSQASQAQVNQDIQGKHAVFKYSDIIELVDEKGTAEDLVIIGTDAASRLKIVNVLINIKDATATAEDVEFVRKALDRPELDIQRNADNQPEVMTDDVRLREINALEVKMRTAPTITNVTANKRVKIKPGADQLVNSYHAAMQYNARPICTLEEYIDFLGDRGLRVGKVSPQDNNTLQGTRWFPAVYYSQIRAYRAGPPPAIPPAQITHTEVTSDLSGVSTIPTTEEVTQEVVVGLPADFPENRDDWTSVLLAYRDSVLFGQAPRT